MLDLVAYKELGKELNGLLDKAKEAVAEEKYDLLPQILFQNEALLERHSIILAEINSLIKNNHRLMPEEQEAITEMQTILGNWNNETLKTTKILEIVKNNTNEALKKVQQGKQVIHTYHPHRKPTSRFIDTQQ